MSKYDVSPVQAYVNANYPHGDLVQVGRAIPCLGCGEPARAYSGPGAREIQISQMCEPCFDFVTWPGDEERPAWMRGIKYSDEYLERTGVSRKDL